MLGSKHGGFDFFMQKLKPVEQQFNKNNRPYNTKALFSHPFCPEFWRCAAGEFKNWRMLVFAAVIIAMRIAGKGRENCYHTRGAEFRL